MPIVPSPEIWSRDDFPYLCIWRKLYTVVEVGVDRGVWSRLFLDRWAVGRQWWGIDEWASYPEMPWDRDADYRMALANIQPHSHRAKLIRLPSVGAAKLFADGSIDFVYVDAAHDRASVAADIAAWWPKVSEHGILAGHDLDDQECHAGVTQAVTEFAEAEGLTVYTTAVEPYVRETCPSWYVYRAGVMPGSDWRRC